MIGTDTATTTKPIGFSHFANIGDKNPRTISVCDFINNVKTGSTSGRSLQELIEKIRSEQDHNIRSKLKKSLPAVTISSICQGGHKKEDIRQLTGYLQIDIDNLENVTQEKEILKTDPYIHILFLSPSGNGLKCIMKIGNKKPSEVFENIRIYFKEKYSILIDSQVKDESRLCFYSYDPDIFVNEAAVIYSFNLEKSLPEQSNLTKNIDSLIKKVELAKLDTTTLYNDWLMLAFALCHEYGAEGEPYFHRLSQFNENYNKVECSKKYHDCLKTGSNKITIKSLISFLNKKLETTYPKDNNAKSEKQIVKDLVFYYPAYDNKGALRDLKIDYTKFMDVLLNLGFRRYDIDKSFVFVRMENQIIEEVTVTHIQDAFIFYLEGLPEKLNNEITREFLIGKFYRNPSHYFCENRLNLLRPKEPFVFTADGKEDCRIYFNNGFVFCTKEGYQLLPYTKLSGLIWKNQIVERDFAFLDTMLQEPLERGEFSNFIYNVCGKDLTRYESLVTIIGYLLHSHFSGKLKATIFTDSKISDMPSGRTGKTLLGQALAYIKKYTEINAKDFDPANKHKYQEANLDTQIIHLNDVKKNFDIESLFNDITEGIVVDKKNVKPFKVKTKLMISANKTIRIEGASAKDRVVEFEFAEHYNEKFSPEDEFGHWFFRDWSEAEWMKFYNFFLFCICSYLKKGIIVAPPINLNRRKLLENTSQEFVEFMDEKVNDGEIKPGVEYNKKVLLELFLADSPEFAEIKGFKQRRFTEWLKYYAKYSGHFSAIDQNKHERKSGPDRFIIFPIL